MDYANLRKCPHRHARASHTIAEFVVLIGLNRFIEAMNSQKVFSAHHQVATRHV